MHLPANFASLTEESLRLLIDARWSEGQHVEFKRELPGPDAGAKHEFVADVSAFANASGGDLVFGIEEDGDGTAMAIVPQGGSGDAEALRLQDMLMHGVEPRIPGAQVRAIPVTGGFAMVVRVPQSVSGPHRVASNRHFYVREGARKRQLDIPEIRALFLRSESTAQRVRDFRAQRVGRVIAGETPVTLEQGARLVAHFVPTQAALGVVSIDPVSYMQDRQLPVMGSRIPAARVNLDGAVVTRGPTPGSAKAYSILFRNGFFETVQVYEARDGHAVLPSLNYEQHLIALLRALRAEYEHWGVRTEMTCMLSLVDASNLKLGVDRWRNLLEDHQGVFDRPVLFFPDVTLMSDDAPEHALKPVFDLVWQAAGLAESANYRAGVWHGR